MLYSALKIMHACMEKYMLSATIRFSIDGDTLGSRDQ